MRVTDLEEAAWGLLVNISVGDGEWESQTPEWQEAAARWREQYHAKLGEKETSPEDRLSNLERDLGGVTQAVMLLQTLAMAQGMRQSMEGAGPSKWQVAQDLDPDAEVELVDGSKIKIKDVPLGEDGQPEEEWAMKNCPCETHKAKRRALAEAKDGPPQTGLYL